MKKVDLIFLNNSFDLDLIKAEKIKLNDLYVLTINPAIEHFLSEKNINYLSFNSFLNFQTSTKFRKIIIFSR